MRLRNRITQLAIVCLFVAPCAVRADVVFTQYINPTPQISGPTFFGGYTTTQTGFSLNPSGTLDLNGASGNLVVQVLNTTS